MCFNISMKKSNCLLSRLFRSIQDNSFFLGGQWCWYGLYFGIFDIYIGIRDICPKTISGYLKKIITKGYGIFVVNYFGNGILGPPSPSYPPPTPPHPTKTNLHDIPGQNANIPWPFGMAESKVSHFRYDVGRERQAYLGSPLPSLSICAYKWPWCVQTFFAFWPARCKHQNAVSLPPCDTSNGVIPLANWWRHVQGR